MDVSPVQCDLAFAGLTTLSVGQNVILAHASAVDVYRREFKPKQGGVIGITLNGDWQMPWDDTPESEAALYHTTGKC